MADRPSSQRFDLQRMRLFTEHLLHLGQLVENNISFLENTKEIVATMATFINASAGWLQIEDEGESYVGSFGVSESTLSNLNTTNGFAESDINELFDPFCGYIKQEIYLDDNTPVGSFCFVNREDRHGYEDFKELDRQLVEIVAQKISLALKKYRHFKNQQSLLELNKATLEANPSALVVMNKHFEIIFANVLAKELFELQSIPKKEWNLNHLMPENSPVLNYLRSILKQDRKSRITGIPISAQHSELYNVYVSPLDYQNSLYDKEACYLVLLENATEFNRLKQTVSKYVNKDVVSSLNTGKDVFRLGGTKKRSAVLFCDIRGFTTMSEGMAAEDVVENLNQYFSAMLRHVDKNKGIIDKLVGDEIMAIFYHDTDAAHPAERACLAALNMIDALTSLNEVRTLQNLDPLYAGIGINYGPVISGNIGSVERMDYTVIGDTVNLAARLCDIASQNEIIVTSKVCSYLSDNYDVTPHHEPVQVKGKKQIIEIASLNQLNEKK